MMRFKTFNQYVIFIFLFLQCALSAMPAPLSFETLSQIENQKSIADVEKKIGSFHGQEVEIRGFLYQNNKGSWVLASEPNLRTCCVGSQANLHRQIFIKGEFAKPPFTTRAVAVQGRFHISPEINEKGELIQLFALNNPSIASNDMSPWLVAFLFVTGGGILGLILRSCLCKERKLRSFNLQNR